MARLRRNFTSGTITDNPLAAGASTINSGNFANLPAVVSPDIVVLVLDPLGTAGVPEVAYVTAHTAAATSVTALRGQETALGGGGVAGTGRQHAQGIPWILADTAGDAPQIYSKATALGVGTNATASFADVPGPVDLAFTKRYTHTALAVWGTMTHYAGNAQGLTAHAVLINGTDYSLGDYFFNTNVLGTHMVIGMGAIVAGGLAAGQYTARLRFRATVANTPSVSTDGNDVANFFIQECL